MGSHSLRNGMIAGKNEFRRGNSIVWFVFFVLLTSFVVSALAVGWFARARLALDQPNERSLHDSPVPRTGGIGLSLGIAGGWAIALPALAWPFWSALALLIIVSFLDDYLAQGLSAALRFGTHLLAAALVVATLPPLNGSFAYAVPAALVIAWMCNLYNFMDGSDGLAGGMTAVGFFCYALAAVFFGHAAFALTNFAIAGAAAGFLVYNFHPARIFLGDAGSIPLGFLAAVFGLQGWLDGIWPWWFPLLVFSPFIVDATVTLARRVFARVAVWRAHRDHYYQRLVRLGWGHRRTALAEYALMVACGAAALAGRDASPGAQWVLLLVAGLVYAALITTITLAWRDARVASQS